MSGGTCRQTNPIGVTAFSQLCPLREAVHRARCQCASEREAGCRGSPEPRRQRRVGLARTKRSLMQWQGDPLRSSRPCRRAFDGDRLAGRGVELQALHAVEVATGDAHEAAALGIVDGMDGADVVDAGMARLETVALDLLEPGLARAITAVEPLVLAHVGILDRLAVDRPRAAVIVRRALVRLGIAVCQHDEAQVLVFVELARADRRGRSHGLLDERLVGEQLLQQRTYLLPPARSGVGLEGGL